MQYKDIKNIPVEVVLDNGSFIDYTIVPPAGQTFVHTLKWQGKKQL